MVARLCLAGSTMPQMCPRFRCQAASLLMRQADRGEHLRPVILLMSTMGSSEARASSKNDAHCPCPGNVANMRELPARGRSWPKKLVRHSQQHPVRLATLNVGTLTGRSRELADSLRKRCADICCAQETPWKGSKSRELGDKSRHRRSGIASTLYCKSRHRRSGIAGTL
ncbi:hypothetical protein RB195_013404 [Necator americanus]|uniref:Endonuclease/exonuclease/phosphatase domain-containing protein n=1 Tax=Necator americanus TaxID=51031 RepID=A0ABR1DWV7_NECAM